MLGKGEGSWGREEGGEDKMCEGKEGGCWALELVSEKREGGFWQELTLLS